MPVVIKQKMRNQEHYSYFMGVSDGRVKSPMGAAVWVVSEIQPRSAEVFDTKQDAIDHAKIVFPGSLSHLVFEERT